MNKVLGVAYSESGRVSGNGSVVRRRTRDRKTSGLSSSPRRVWLISSSFWAKYGWKMLLFILYHVFSCWYQSKSVLRLIFNHCFGKIKVSREKAV